MKRAAGRKTARSSGTKAGSRGKPRKARQSAEEPRGPIVTRDGKTTIRHFDGRRIVRMGEVWGKRVARLELFTAREAHYLTLGFQDQTVLSLEITPLFTLKPALYRLAKGDPEVIRKWAEIRSER